MTAPIQPCPTKMLNSKTYRCHFELTLGVIGGKWKMIILYYLSRQVMRFGELKRALPGITERMLVRQLRELEQDGIVHRKVYTQVPPCVEYSLTEIGTTLVPVVLELRDWGVMYEQAMLPNGVTAESLIISEVKCNEPADEYESECSPAIVK